MYTYYISVGSNIGDKRGYINSAFHLLQGHEAVSEVISSSLIETEPWGYTDQASMISICAETLTIPHPYFWDRAFVLEPLHELLPTFTYKGMSISERLATLSLA